MFDRFAFENIPISQSTWVTVLVAAIIIAVSVVIGQSLPSSIPKVSFQEYLPGGLVFHIIRDARLANQCLHKLRRKYGSTFHMFLGPLPVTVVSEAEDNAYVLTRGELFPKAKSVRQVVPIACPGSVFNMEGTEHAFARRKLRENFSHPQFPSFHKHLQAALTEAILHLSEAVSMKLKPDEKLEFEGLDPRAVDIGITLQTLTFRMVMKAAFGCDLPLKERRKLSKLLDDVMGQMGFEVLVYHVKQMFAPFETRRKFLKVSEEAYQACLGFVSARLKESPQEKEERSPDLLDGIVDLHSGKPDGIKSLVGEALFHAMAGSQTTALVLQWTFFELSKPEHKHILIKIREEVDQLCRHLKNDEVMPYEVLKDLQYTKCVWLETLRLRPVVSNTLRQAAYNAVLPSSGVKVKAGSVIMVLGSAAHKDQAYWTNPEQFRPERWGMNGKLCEGDLVKPGAYTPFNLGQFSCAGTNFAHYEGIFTLAELCRRFEFQLACNASDIWSCSGGLEMPKYTSKDGSFEMGLPLIVSLREK